jgi:tRNA uridine 5-carboxymethylaminomethyl modification enzyme
VETEIKYEGYIHRQIKEVEKFKNMEQMRIPDNFDYNKVHGLSNELKEKLSAVMPSSIGQASRIDGITPAGLSVIMVAIKAAERKTSGIRQRPSNVS